IRPLQAVFAVAARFDKILTAGVFQFRSFGNRLVRIECVQSLCIRRTAAQQFRGDAKIAALTEAGNAQDHYYKEGREKAFHSESVLPEDRDAVNLFGLGLM